MAKAKTIYVCQACGVTSPKWVGRCPSCGEWNTYIEEVEVVGPKSKPTSPNSSILQRPLTLAEIPVGKTDRFSTSNQEFDRVLGGGLVPGSIVLLGGEPGIGKSTLALQMGLNVKDKLVLYISGEESLEQIKLRSTRLTANNENCLFLSETSLENILAQIDRVQPELLVIDSIQTVSTEMIDSGAGSVSQIRECTAGIMQKAKAQSIPVILIGHINKEGSIAGPKVLEHVVDTVLQFEGDRNYMYRILRASKNRFGSTSEIGIFEMKGDGLREVSNPSELLLSVEHQGLSGTAVAAAIEGVRPFLIEVQALVSSAAYGVPQRSATGFDLRRLNMLLAVLEKRAGFKLVTKDVFLNIAGGIRIVDPASDLAIICAVLSSNFDVAVGSNICFAGEVGLTGEVRPVSRVEQRIGEAAKLGFAEIYIPFANKGIDPKKFPIKINRVKNVGETLKSLFRGA
ncbi:MAG TPA: DNA repair protein RadA [Prolixibacteraceae bacterium]|nr:DNA repair protein RadA [Prolixibacteraceae bacterium]HPS12410.1 DNA repair protein RadA [Prolixibacteraceae bacterium]